MGKDSYVSYELMLKAHPELIGQWFYYACCYHGRDETKSWRIRRGVQVSGTDRLSLANEDPDSDSWQRLAEWSRKRVCPEGVLLDNDSFPYAFYDYLAMCTMFVSTALVAALQGTGKRLLQPIQLVVGHEDSCEEIITRWDGHDVNHQFEKTAASQAKMEDFVRRFVFAEYDPSSCFSLHSPIAKLSELAVAKYLCLDYPQYLPVFLSCNDASEWMRWCGVCSKCVFTCLICSAWLPRPDQSWAIFGENILDDERNVVHIERLLDPSNKPIECVGTRAEVRAALRQTQRQYVRAGVDVPLCVRRGLQFAHGFDQGLVVADSSV
jgi:hypothetical protein